MIGKAPREFGFRLRDTHLYGCVLAAFSGGDHGFPIAGSTDHTTVIYGRHRRIGGNKPGPFGVVSVDLACRLAQHEEPLTGVRSRKRNVSREDPQLSSPRGRAIEKKASQQGNEPFAVHHCVLRNKKEA
jgi:hypothetical protein